MNSKTMEANQTNETSTLTPLIEIKNLKKYFNIGGQPLKAVDDLNLDIYPGENSWACG